MELRIGNARKVCSIFFNRPHYSQLFVRFGTCVEGYDTVKAIEKVGSQSGATSKPVVIADCGQLA